MNPPRNPGLLLNEQDVFDLATVFSESQVRYLIVGGLAVVAHGFTRLTMDVDLVVGFGDGNEERAITALKRLGYQPRIPEAIESFLDSQKRKIWSRDKDMIVFTVWKGTSEVDLFLQAPFDFAAAYADAVWKAGDEAGSIHLPFIDVQRLIAMKQTAQRPKDLEDIRNLRSLWGDRP